jgi:hypothetical protein
MADKDAVKGKRITGSARDSLREDLKAKYEAGTSVRVLAESTGRSYGFVHRVLTEAGVEMRPRGGHPRAKQARPSAATSGTVHRSPRNLRSWS